MDAVHVLSTYAQQVHTDKNVYLEKYSNLSLDVCSRQHIAIVRDKVMVFYTIKTKTWRKSSQAGVMC